MARRNAPGESINDRIFVDTVFIQAMLNPHDQHHALVQPFIPQLLHASELWITEAMRMEVANALSSIDRTRADGFIRRC